MSIFAKQFDPSVPLGPLAWGNARDGDVVISALTNLTQDLLARSLHITSIGQLNPKGWRIFCCTPVIVDGVINGDGAAGTNSSAGGAGGAAGTTGTKPGGSAGGNGGAPANGAGSIGHGCSSSGPFCYLPAGTLGGAGESVVGGGAGGLGGSTFNGPDSGLTLADACQFGALPGGTESFNVFRIPSLGGGGGGADATNHGAGGGAGGDWIEIWAPGLIINATGQVHSRGGVGGNGDLGTAGAGGGGTGGTIRLMCPPGTILVQPGGVLDVSGGAGGTSSGGVATDGANGIIIRPNF